MNVTSSVTAALAAPIPPSVSANVLAAGQLLAEGAVALLGSRGPDLLTTLAGASTPARVALAKKAAASATTTARSTSTATPAKTATTKTAATTTASKASGYGSSTSSDYAFLKDPKLSVDEKLFRFICAVAQKADEDLLKKMDEMKGGAATKAGSTSSASSGTAKSGGFSLWKAAKALIPPLGLATKLVGDAAVKKLLTQVSGPILAAACTAVGLPMLAPLAAKVGPQLATSVAGAVEEAVKKATSPASGSGSGGSSSGTTTNASGSASDSGSAKNEQVQMMELQRMVDKQKEMFSLVSNIMRATHDTRMAVIGNVR